jgi:hypothetical protein
MARESQHASSAELLVEQKLIFKVGARLIARAGPRSIGLQDIVRNGSGKRHHSRLIQAAAVRQSVERIDNEFVLVWAFQKNANTVAD